MTIAIEYKNFSRRDGSEKSHISDMDFVYQETFNIDIKGQINDPGKFEGLPVYVPYYWYLDQNTVFNQVEDEDGRLVTEIEFEDEDYQKWPELRSFRKMLMWEEDAGFVSYKLFLTSPDLDS